MPSSQILKGFQSQITTTAIQGVLIDEDALILGD